MDINDISAQVVDAAMRVHSALGPGPLESAYLACLAHELTNRGLMVRREVLMPVWYDGTELEAAYRIHLLVGNCIVAETKSVARVLAVQEAQPLSRPGLGAYQAGLLMSCN